MRQVLGEPHAQRGREQRRVGVAARWEHAARSDIEIVDAVDSAILVHDARPGIEAHPRRSDLVIAVAGLAQHVA